MFARPAQPGPPSSIEPRNCRSFRISATRSQCSVSNENRRTASADSPPRLNWMMRTAGLSGLIASASLLRVYSGGAGRGAFSAMMALACFVRSSFSLGVKRLSPLTHLLIR